MITTSCQPESLHAGEKRFFACTGIFIKWSGSTVVLTSASLVRKSGDENEIDEDLTVSVHCSVTAVLVRCCLNLITVLFADSSAA